MEENLKYIIESLLFVSEGPLPMDRLKKVLETEDTKEIRQAIDDLSAEYDARGGGFMLREVAGGFQIRTRPEYAKWIRQLVQPGTQRLSKAALETLAIIAYKQPIIRADIEFVRGVDCGGVLRMLLEKKLVRVLGRKEIPGRPMIYATTKQFLELFDLKDLKELPSPKEIEALGNTHVLDTEAVPDEEADGIADDFNLPEATAFHTEATGTGVEESQIETQEHPPSDIGGTDDALFSEDLVPDSEDLVPDEESEAPPIIIETENPDVSPWDTKGTDEFIEEQPGGVLEEDSEEEDPDLPEDDPPENDPTG